MKKVFSLLFALALTSLAKAEIYEIGDAKNDNSIELSTDGTDEGDIVINISLTNPTVSLVGIECYLDFSGGNNNIIEDAVVSDERCKSGRSYTHSTFTGIVKREGPENGQFFLSVNSPSVSALQGTEGVVATIYISGTIADGEYTLKMPSCMCFNREDTYKCAEKELVFTYEKGVVTGINTISADAQNAKYYSVNGAIQNGPQKGVNIVKYANGEVKKVIVK